MVGERKRESLLERAYQLGFEYERIYFGCAQCAIAAIQDTLNVRNDQVFKAATGFGGGAGGTGVGLCGGYVGGVMVFSQLCGRERAGFADPRGIRFKSQDLAKRFMDDYVSIFGTVICRDVLIKIFGRPYYFRDPDDLRRFEEAGGHVQKCPDVVGNASKMAVNIILDEGLVDVSSLIV